jgi:hypothetical protein
MNKSRGKIVQFLAESMKEQLLGQQQATYEMLKDSSKYIVECQQTGQINYFCAFIFYTPLIANSADKSGDCTYMASWIKCVLENVPDLTEVSKRFYDVVEVNLLYSINALLK